MGQPSLNYKIYVISFDKTLTNGTPELTDYWFEDETMIPAVVDGKTTIPLAQAVVQKIQRMDSFRRKKSKWKYLWDKGYVLLKQIHIKKPLDTVDRYTGSFNRMQEWSSEARQL